MFLDYSGYEALTEINSSFGKYIILLQQFESCRGLKSRLEMLKDLGKEFKIFEKLNTKDFRRSKNMVHRFYTMVISLKQIMEIGPLIRRNPAVLFVEFDCPVEDCLDELDPLHPLNKAYIFIHKQWTYYHQYYIVEKVKKLILNMVPVKEDDWSILHKVVYSEGFVERRYKKKQYLGDIYIPQPLLKSNKNTTISNFSQLTKVSKVRVYRFDAAIVCDTNNFNKKNLTVKKLEDKELPNLIWTLEPEKFYVDMRPYKEHQERKKGTEEAELNTQAEKQENNTLKNTENNIDELRSSAGLKNIMKTPLANKVVNIINNYAAVVTGYVTDVEKINDSNKLKEENTSEISYGEIGQEFESSIQVDSGTPVGNACFQSGFQDNCENNISWNTTMRDIDPVYMTEQCARVWRKEQQMLGLEKAKAFERNFHKESMIVSQKQFKESGRDSERRKIFQNLRSRRRIETRASIYDNYKLEKYCYEEGTHGLMRNYFKVKLNISAHRNRLQREKDKRSHVHRIDNNSNNFENTNNMYSETQVVGQASLTDIHFKDVVIVKFRGFRAKLRKLKINA